jgi:hypothetical protein
VYSALGGATESRCPLGEQIGKFFGSLGHLVEELVEGDKVWPLDIPMSLLGLPFEVDRQRQVAVEQPDGLNSDRLRKGVLSLDLSVVHPVHFQLLSFLNMGGASIDHVSNL